MIASVISKVLAVPPVKYFAAALMSGLLSIAATIQAIEQPLDKTAIIIAAITGIVTVVTSIAAVLIGWFNSNKLTDMHSRINSRLDQLLEAQAKIQRAEGEIEGVAKEKAAQARRDEKKG